MENTPNTTAELDAARRRYAEAQRERSRARTIKTDQRLLQRRNQLRGAERRAGLTPSV